MEIELGCTYKDTVTGFIGVATAHVKYLTGCDRTVLTAKYKSDHKDTVTLNFDDLTLEKQKAKKVVVAIESKKPGGPADGRLDRKAY